MTPPLDVDPAGQYVPGSPWHAPLQSVVDSPGLAPKNPGAHGSGCALEPPHHTPAAQPTQALSLEMLPSAQDAPGAHPHAPEHVDADCPSEWP